MDKSLNFNDLELTLNKYSMYQIVYLSSAVQAFTEEELRQILTRSRKNNEKVDVTGVLLYNDGNIIQVLEGSQADVINTYNRIHKDYRHRGIIKLLERAIEERAFPDWSMGYRVISSNELNQLAGYFKPNQVSDFKEGDNFKSTEVISLLKTFATVNSSR